MSISESFGPLELDRIPIRTLPLRPGIKSPFLVPGTVHLVFAEPNAALPLEFSNQLAYSSALGRPNLMGYLRNFKEPKRTLLATRVPISALRDHWQQFRSFHGLQEHCLNGRFSYFHGAHSRWGIHQRRQFFNFIKYDETEVAILPSLQQQTDYSDARAIAEETGCSIIYLGNWCYEQAMSPARNLSTVFQLRTVKSEERGRMRLLKEPRPSERLDQDGPLLSLDNLHNTQSYAHPNRIIFSAQTERANQLGRKTGGANLQKRIVSYKPIAIVEER